MQTQNPFPGPAQVDGYQTLSGTCSDSDQVNLFSGNLLRQVSLISVPTVGEPLSFSLYYNSQASPGVGAVGQFWRHNLMAHLDVGETSVTFTDGSGREYDFEWSGSAWVLSSSSHFVPMTLVNVVGNRWRIQFAPGGTYFDFWNSSIADKPSTKGRLVGIGDTHGNTLTLDYSRFTGNLERMTDPTGRALIFKFTDDLLTRVTDPQGNIFLLGYDGEDNLTTVAGPEGCVLTYGYAVPENHLVTSRTDAKSQTYSYSYDESGRLLTVEDAETNTLTYSYDDVEEYVADPDQFTPDRQEFKRTTLLDARGKTWEFRFTQAGELWRSINPLGHQRRYYWSPEGRLLFETGPFNRPATNAEELTLWGPKDNLNNVFRRRRYNSRGSLIQVVDGIGQVSEYVYDENQNVLEETPGRANTEIQGAWRGRLGEQGHVLCAYLDESSDVARLPAYVDSLVNGDGSSGFLFERHQPIDDTPALLEHLMDSRIPELRLADGTDKDYRGLGYWRRTSSNEQFCFRLLLTEATSFNLSLYTHSSDMVYGPALYPFPPNFPMRYAEQFGREVEFVVDDLNPETNEPRQQVFRVPNNAPGIWVTFTVHGTEEDAIRVTVRGLSSTLPMLSAIAFDAAESRTTRFSYDEDQSLIQAVDPLGNVTTYAYNEDGTLESTTDPLERETQFFYEDTAKNLTRIVDAASGETLYTYDLNGNVLTAQDPDDKVQRMQYDGRNRLVLWRDQEGQQTQLVYDPNGNLWKVIDSQDRVTEMLYTPDNRLESIVDALGNEVAFAYDEAGALTQVTDARGNVTGFVYDDAGRLVQVIYPDTSEQRLSLDGLNRLLAVTGPNGNQTDLNEINLTGSFNHLRNPSAEELVSVGEDRARFWVASAGSQARSTATAHEGIASLPLSPTDATEPYWTQKRVPSLAGARYVMRGWARKTSDSISATVTMQARVRDFTAALVDVDSTTPLTLDGSSAAWSDMALSRVDVSADAQFTASNPPVHELRVRSSAEDDTSVWIDDLELLNLSTGYLYDSEGMREVRLPDGSRMRMERDRYGRINRYKDSLGRVTTIRYDAVDRVVAVVDPLGHLVEYSYDAVSRLVSFTDARGSVTGYEYDELDRLERIVYPDTSDEQFAYTPGGDLASYTNVRGQVRTFTYDDAHRLLSITYATDSSTVDFSYDRAGNLKTLVERNGDRLYFSYDRLNRLIGTSRTRAELSETPTWAHSHEYDANGNRTAFHADGPIFGTALYGTARYGVGNITGGLYGSALYGTGRYAFWPMGWKVPDPGYDPMNRMPAFQDPQGKEVSFAFDIEGRRTSIVYPNALETQASYDIVGRLLGLTTGSLLELEYGYTAASERVAMRHNDDTWEYRLDDLGRLVEEAVNRMVDRTAGRFAEGELEGTEIDATENSVKLLSRADDFGGEHLNSDRWRYGILMPESELDVRLYPYGLRAYQSDGLRFAFPRGGTNLICWYDPPLFDNYGIDNSLDPVVGRVCQAAEHRRMLSGDFDVCVDFEDLALGRLSSGTGRAYLMASTAPMEEGGGTFAWVGRQQTSTSTYHMEPGDGSASTTDTAGRLRLRRVGNDISGYYWDGDEWVELTPEAADIGTNDMYVTLVLECDRVIGNVLFANFGPTDPGEEANWPEEGTYTSGVMDAQRSVTWSSIRWEETLPADTDVEFQVAVSDSPDGPFNFVGPNGTGGTKFSTPAGEALPTLNGRYLRYKAFLSSDGFATPSFGNVQIAFSGLQTSSVTSYEYDAAGNRTRKLVETDAGVVLEELLDDAGWSAPDRINNLNQVMRRDVTDIGGTTSWAFTYDPDGNMASKTDGVDTWTYTWDEDNRLRRIEGPGGLDIEFEYDSMGRMLRRVDGSDSWAFEWDGWDLVRETAPDGTVTRYFCPQGELHRFQRGNEFYSVHADALGSVRMITDAAGRVVSHFEYGAFGETLESSVDGVPGGFPYRFVGALGCRADDEIGLIYMRQRWYDASSLSMFVSRELLATSQTLVVTLAPSQASRVRVHPYAYVSNNPTNYIDPNGLWEVRGNPPPDVARDLEAARDILFRVARNAKCEEFFETLEQHKDKQTGGKCDVERRDGEKLIMTLLRRRLVIKYDPNELARRAPNSGTPAATDPKTRIIYINAGVNKWGTYGTAEYILHELLHVAGYSHLKQNGDLTKMFQDVVKACLGESVIPT